MSTQTSRDFADELRRLSLQALGRLLNQALRRGDEQKAVLIEREIDRRARGRRDRRRREVTFADKIKRYPPRGWKRKTRTKKAKKER